MKEIKTKVDPTGFNSNENEQLTYSFVVTGKDGEMVLSCEKETLKELELFISDFGNKFLERAVDKDDERAEEVIKNRVIIDLFSTGRKDESGNPIILGSKTAWEEYENWIYAPEEDCANDINQHEQDL